jgi:hypothetical protein
MKISMSCSLRSLLAGVLLCMPAFAQVAPALTAEDATAIQALVTGYARALSACRAEEYADLFAPGTGYFASGFRGQVVGRERLIALVQSERQCAAPAAAAPGARPAAAGPTVALEITADGVRGTADLGAAGQYQDEYGKTPNGWRFRSRTVLTPAEKAAGLDAGEIQAIQRLAGGDPGDYYVADQNGVKRLRSSGVAIAISAGTVTGRAYQKNGGHYEDVYEKITPGQWRIKSRTFVPAVAP